MVINDRRTMLMGKRWQTLFGETFKRENRVVDFGLLDMWVDGKSRGQL